MTQHNQDNQKAPQEGRAVIYQRPTASQVAPTQPQQVSDLVLLAREYGLTDITVFADGYVAGSAEIIEREILLALLQSITNPTDGPEPTRAIFASSEDRLFRDVDSRRAAAARRRAQAGN